MSSKKDFVKIYNKQTGKWQMQHHKGGLYFDNIKQIRPSNLHNNITGKGHPAPHSKKAIEETMDIVEQNNIGDKILASLRKNQQHGMGMEQESHYSIEQRIKKLIMGSGLQVY
jgi:hypothetical protein